jgi:hypothetical protein
MYIDRSDSGYIEDVLRDDFAIGDDDEKVWFFVLEP